jgi:hypothetical protein
MKKAVRIVNNIPVLVRTVWFEGITISQSLSER